ncbi:MAG: DUF1428 domain-containing protein [Candidatus Eisenbacteria bacterium]|nr:DUF1428 domain-containing protein [Candidatus Eisenbacteria bacterium]
MAPYIDGFILPISKKKVAAYQKMSRKAGKIWREHGALEYRECVGDDLAVKGMPSFSKLAGAKSGETVIFSWIVYMSRAHRDRVNARVMKDPRLEPLMDVKAMPFDIKRMTYGGFKVFVEA